MNVSKQVKKKILLLFMAFAFVIQLSACQKKTVYSRQLFELDNGESIRVLLNEEENEYVYRMEEKEDGVNINNRDGETILSLNFISEELVNERLNSIQPSVKDKGELGEGKYVRPVETEGEALAWLVYFDHALSGVSIRSAAPEMNDMASEILHWLSFEVVQGNGERENPEL